MKFFAFILTLALSSGALADERIFDCTAKNISKSQSLPEELQLLKNPTLLFKQFGNSKKLWTLQIGELVLHTSFGPAVKMDSSYTNDAVTYDFWVDGSYEYQLVIDTEDTSAKLFWWGTGEATPVADFNCLMVEQ